MVMGVGTGGTLIGVGPGLPRGEPCRQALRDGAVESSTILCGEIGDHLIEGISDGFVPGIFERHQNLVDTALTVDSEEAVEEMRRLAKQYGLFVGPSSGANLIAVRKVRESFPELETIITLFCDEGEKYISEHFAAKDGVRLTSENYT
jgi:cysteine synthase A